MIWIFRAWGDEYRRGFESGYPIASDRVAAEDQGRVSETLQVSVEVVDKAIVVIQQQDHGLRVA